MGADAGSSVDVAGARGAGGAPQGGAEARGPEPGANRDNASSLSHSGHARAACEDKSSLYDDRIRRVIEARKARFRKDRILRERKFKPVYRVVRFDPFRLSSRYSEAEIRKMIAEGRVIELKGRRRLIIRP